ncbi:hypothetical protein PG994_000062 [Apiospora phragmitis]|uniref:Uncharacterized protein n=1 Tax=Apiospora phragmitis TaxID=2905665 RepID=A0ABR1X5B4_9PEZI
MRLAGGGFFCRNTGGNETMGHVSAGFLDTISVKTQVHGAETTLVQDELPTFELKGRRGSGTVWYGIAFQKIDVRVASASASVIVNRPPGAQVPSTKYGGALRCMSLRRHHFNTKNVAPALITSLDQRGLDDDGLMDVYV